MVSLVSHSSRISTLKYEYLVRIFNLPLSISAFCKTHLEKGILNGESCISKLAKVIDRLWTVRANCHGAPHLRSAVKENLFYEKTLTNDLDGGNRKTGRSEHLLQLAAGRLRLYRSGMQSHHVLLKTYENSTI